jgi:adenylate cyclase
MEHRLAAILAADVAGYTRLVEQDSESTVTAWKAARVETIDPSIASHSGRIVKLTGDGFLAEFPSVQNAVKCAVKMQEELLGNPLDFRMAVNLGDIIDDGEDIHGEGVNIAARIEGLTDPGSVFISGGVYEQVRNRLDYDFEDLGAHEVKHVSEPVRVYAIRRPGAGTHHGLSTDSDTLTPGSNAGDRPRVAVHPLQVVGDDNDLTGLAQGLPPGIIDGLSKCTALTVAGSDSRTADFVLDGTARAVGQRLRLTFALTDVENDAQVWSERYDRTMNDIFELEDEIAQTVVYMVRLRLKDMEFGRLEDMENAQLSVPDLLSKAAGYLVRGYRYIAEARAPVVVALTRDSDNSMAHAMMAACIYGEAELSPLDLSPMQVEDLERHIETAVTLNSSAFFEPLMKGILQADVQHDFTGARVQAEIALQHNPQLVPALALVAIVDCHIGDIESGLEKLRQILAAGRRDPHRYRHERELALALLLSGRERESADVLGRFLSQAPELRRNELIFAALLALSGNVEAANRSVNSLVSDFPDLTVKTMRPTSIGVPSVKERFIQALVDAGLPQS